MEVLNALDLKNGKKATRSNVGAITQPIQFIPRSQKTEEWKAWNMDFLEWEGMRQLRVKAPRLAKNYKLVNGVIDKSDYLVEENNEYRDVLDTLADESGTALDLKFFPIIPNVINTLCSEFAKRNTKTTYRAIDEFSYNELLEQKRLQIERVLLSDAKQKIVQQLIESGVDPDDPEIAAEMQQRMSDQNLRTLPEIEEFFSKTYRSQAEQWASHQHQVDVDRFEMDELELRGFKDSLTTDSEFWHFKMMDDDYDVELWNPMLTFYNKSPSSRYISQGNYVGKFDMMTVADVIDKYGWVMTKDQMESLEANYPVQGVGYALAGYQNDGTQYDATRSHEWNVGEPGLAMRQYNSVLGAGYNGDAGDIVDWITRQSENYYGRGINNANYMLRVTTIYWKSQRKVGYLTKIEESGEVVIDIVDEDYKITSPGIYNNTLIKNKNKDTLIFGEHIDWIWVNEVWGGIKIGPNMPSYWGMQNPGGVAPIYLGVNQNRIGPLKFQFRGDKNLYGCKLPVEGAVFSDYNTKSTSLVDKMKPFQVMYNVANNQIADILVDELGTVVAFDPRFLPKHSLGEDWGENNYPKAWTVMKNFQVLPMNYSLENGPMTNGGQPLTKLDLEQTNRLLSRVNLANHFKQQAFEVIGVNLQRMGQQMGRQTATGVEENLNASYAQTEMYFINHSDHLMPRVHQMRTDLSQHYNSTKPSLRLQYSTSNDEKVNFEMNGTELLLRDINVYATSKALTRNLLEQLKNMALEKNTTGATIYDLGGIVMSESIAEINTKLKAIETKANAAAELAHKQEMEKIQAENESIERQKQMDLDWKAVQEQQNREKDILVAKIRAAGFTGTQDIDQNGQNDYQDFLDREDSRSEFNQAMSFEQNKEQNRTSLTREKLNIEREKIASAERLKQVDLQVARTNKNQYDAKKKADQNKKPKK